MPARKKEDPVDIQVSTAELSRVLGISVTRIDKLISQGHIPKPDPKHHLPTSVRAYCARLRDQAAGRISAVDKSAAEADGVEVFDAIQEGARLKARQSEMLELKLAQARGEVMPMSDMLEVWQRIISAAKSKLMALPASLQTQIHGLTRDDLNIIQDTVRQLLEDLVEDGEKAPAQVRQMALEES